MRQLLLSLVTLFFLCISCSKENQDIETENVSRQMHVTVYYTTKDNHEIKLSDCNSKLYIYDGRYSPDLSGYCFQDGTFTKGEEAILPDQNIIIEKGEITFYLDQTDKPFTVVVESYFHKRATTCSYPSGKEDIDLTLIFNP